MTGARHILKLFFAFVLVRFTVCFLTVRHQIRLPSKCTFSIGSDFSRGQVAVTWRISLLECSHRNKMRSVSALLAERKDVVDEDDEIQAYGNRSLGWTKKYRHLVPYDKARKSVMDLGLRSKDEWDEYVSDGKVYHGPYLPNRPDEMYAEEWVSWDEFLGLMRPYEETRHMVQRVLHLQNMEEYNAFVSADAKRAEGLRIPAMPHIVYKDKGWTTTEEFFGNMQ